MKSFKQFIRTPKIGFATIHKNDKSDEALKPPVRIGFATIHKDDKSDALLAKIARTLRLKEDSEPALEVSHAFHDNYLKHVAEKEGARYEHQVTEDKPHQKEIDERDFGHHHALNMDHEEEHGALGVGGSRISPLRGYTEGSHGLNMYLIKKHLDPDHPTNETHEKRHALISKETNHRGNALYEPTIVHSGAGHEMSEVLRSTKVGERLHFPAYTSTSTHSRTAKLFSHNVDEGNKVAQHILHFHLPAGYRKGRHVENITGNEGEHEMILHHGQTFKKVDHFTEQNPKDHTHVYQHHHFVPVD